MPAGTSSEGASSCLRAEQQQTDAVFKAIADGADEVDPSELQDLLFRGLMAPKEEEAKEEKSALNRTLRRRMDLGEGVPRDICDKRHRLLKSIVTLEL